MICHMIGRPPISTIGLGLINVLSLTRVPYPPAILNVDAAIRRIDERGIGLAGGFLLRARSKQAADQ